MTDQLFIYLYVIIIIIIIVFFICIIIVKLQLCVDRDPQVKNLAGLYYVHTVYIYIYLSTQYLK